MKTFNDLEFKQHPGFPSFSTCSEMIFNNGYGVSVITGNSAYSSDAEPYEVAILKGNEICYHTGITEDVLGYQTAENVSEIMKLVQELPPTVEPKKKVNPAPLNSSKHTEGKWEVLGNKLIVDGKATNSICTIHIRQAWDNNSNKIQDFEAEANARIICTAVNNHNALIDIAQSVQFMFSNEANYPEGTQGYRLAKEAKEIISRCK